MKNAEQLYYRELNPTEAAGTNGGFDPLELLAYLADTIFDMIDDPDCRCDCGTVVYHP